MLDTSCRKSEPMTGVGEGALGEREDLGRLDLEREGHPAILVVKAVAFPLVLPSPVPFRGPCRGEALEHIIVGNLDGITLDHDIEPCFPMGAAGHDNYVRVPMKVLGLLFGRASGEVESPIEPHSNEWSHMGLLSARTVEIQNSSAVSSTRRVSSHGVATAPGLLVVRGRCSSLVRS